MKVYSKEYLHRYLSEFEFRYNARKLNDGDRTLLRSAPLTESGRCAESQDAKTKAAIYSSSDRAAAQRIGLALDDV